MRKTRCSLQGRVPIAYNRICPANERREGRCAMVKSGTRTDRPPCYTSTGARHQQGLRHICASFAMGGTLGICQTKEGVNMVVFIIAIGTIIITARWNFGL